MSSLFRSVITVTAFLVALGVLAWPGSAAAWGGSSIVFRDGSGHFGHRQTVFFAGTLFRQRFGRGHDFRAGRVFRHFHPFISLRPCHLRGGFDHGRSVLIFRR